LARMVSDPSYRRRVAGDSNATLATLRLDARERKRLTSFAVDPGMRINTVLYRANRLAPIDSAMSRTCAELRENLAGVLTRFWTSNELVDLQFPNEAARFFVFLSRDPVASALRGLLGLAEVELTLFELLVAPRRSLLAQERALRRARGPRMHPLERLIAVAVEPSSLIAVLEQHRPLAECRNGSGGVLVDHRADVAKLTALTDAEMGDLNVRTAWPARAGAGRSRKLRRSSQ